MDLAGTTGPIFSPRHFNEFYLPRMQQLIGLCHTKGVPFFKHTDGNLGALEKPLLVDTGLDGYHAIEPSAGMDIRRLKRDYAGRLTLLGHVDCGSTLIHGSRDDIRAEVRGLIRDVAPGGGYVLSSSNSIHSDVPTKNYLIMLEAAREFGAYPVRA